MLQKNNGGKKKFIQGRIFFTFLFVVLFVILHSSNNASAEVPTVIIDDSAPLYINESSEPVCVLSLTITDIDGGLLQNITVTVENITGSFDPYLDLTLLSADNLSGLMIYEETNFQPGFQLDDNPMNIYPIGWTGSGPWSATFYNLSRVIPNSTSGSNFYIVIRTGSGISDGDSFRVGIEAFDIGTYHGAIPSTSSWSKIITADTLDPSITTITASSENPVAKVGDWLNITATIAGNDAVSVTINLTDFNGLSEFQNMISDNGSRFWYYNITSLLEGNVDTDGSDYYFEVMAWDKIGKSAINGNFTRPIDTTLPAISVFVYQEFYPATIGSWINISAVTSLDSQSVVGDLSAFSGLGASEVFSGFGDYWYFNFTVLPGSLDGTGSVNVTVFDDAGNSNENNSKTADVDEIIPLLEVVILQQSIPSGIGDWINITVSTDADVLMVEVNLAAAGFSNQIDNQSLVDLGGGNWYYNFTISSGSYEGSNKIVVEAENDVGYIVFNSTQSAFWDEKIPLVYVLVSQEVVPAGIGNWINITVNTDSDVVNVTGDILEFSGQVKDTPFIYSGTYWYYNFSVEPGSLDGLGSIIVTVYDSAGNLNINITQTASVDEVVPEVYVMITQESDPVKIGDWINITANTDSVVISVKVDLASAGFAGQVDDQDLIWSGSIWYYRFVVSAGAFDGTGTFTVRAADNAGNLGINDTQFVSWDEIMPTLEISIAQSSSVAGVGDTINISVTTDIDVSAVTVDLAQAGFSGQINDQPLIQIDSTTWYYLFTIISGGTDASEGNSVVVTVFDDAGNVLSNSEVVYFDEVYPEPVSVNVISQNPGSTHAKIGDWINITVDAGGNSDILFMWVDAPGILTSQPAANTAGSIWNLNFTLSGGSSDGFVQFAVITIDDAGNLNNTKYASILIDNIPPEPSAIDIEQASTPARTGDWINISLDMEAHRDIALIFVDAPGVYSNEPMTTFSGSIWYLNNTISEGTANGSVQFTVTITDDSGNIISVSDTVEVVNLPPPPVKLTPHEGLPWGLILIIACAAAVGTGGAVLAATEIGHYSFFFFFYLLYTRLKKEYILDNFTRGRIYGYIEANPGEHFNAIKRALGLKNGSLAYHLRTLEKKEFIVSKRDRGYTRFYPKSMKLPNKNINELIPIQRNILGIVSSEPGISQRGIADKMKISYQLVHYHIKVLQNSEYLFLKKDKKQTYCYDSDEFLESTEPVEA